MNEYGRPTRLDEAAKAVHVAQRCGTDRRPACHVPLPAGQGYHINLTVNSLPDRRSGALAAKRVVTGGKTGLRANSGKGFAKKIPRAALVTGWHGAAIHRAATGSVVG